jgi:hypothetical protein
VSRSRPQRWPTVAGYGERDSAGEPVTARDSAGEPPRKALLHVAEYCTALRHAAEPPRSLLSYYTLQTLVPGSAASALGELRYTTPSCTARTRHHETSIQP